MNGRQMYFPAYWTSQVKEHRLSLDWIYCVLFARVITYACRISLWFTQSPPGLSSEPHVNLPSGSLTKNTNLHIALYIYNQERGKKAIFMCNSRGDVSSLQHFLPRRSNSTNSSHNLLSPPEPPQLPLPFILTTTVAQQKKTHTQWGTAWNARV